MEGIMAQWGWRDYGMGPGMMWGWWGMGWIFMIIFWGLLIVGLIFLIRYLIGPTKGTRGEESALDILKSGMPAGRSTRKNLNRRRRTSCNFPFR
jgi:putative membrane protein